MRQLSQRPARQTRETSPCRISSTSLPPLNWHVHRCPFSRPKRSGFLAFAFFSNADTFDRAFAEHLACDVYAARIARCDPVAVVELPSAAIVHGATFLTLSGGFWLRDQCHPALLMDATHVQALKNGAALTSWVALPTCDIDAPCVLAARYGETTWGHWLAELLPRALVAEKAKPGFFTFAIPDFPVADSYDMAFRRNALGSLAGYGIGANRLLLLSPSRLYRFASLTIATPAWTDPLMIHPNVIGLMRQVIGGAGIFPSRIFLTRNASTGRTATNESALTAAAKRRGYAPVALTELSFTDQIRCFAGATKVVSVLGSDLAGLLYAPDGVGVLSLAPGNWGDRFFYTLMQLREGRYADVRGTPARQGALHRMPFTVKLKIFEEALDRIE